MDLRLQQAAESGSINELYALIDENPYILENIDAVPFVSTPLHVAAVFGNIEFAMEMLNLKPSFARKLNTSGYSPLHLAVEKEQSDFVSHMLWHDGGLSRVKGRNGVTPFHLLVIRGDDDLVAECLITSPECIEDVNVDRQNALHLAVMNDRFEVLQALKLLLKCRLVEPNLVNIDDLTFVDILRTQGENAGGGNLDLEQAVIKTGCVEAASMPKFKEESDLLKSPINFMTYYSTSMKRMKSSTSDQDRGAFLIVCTLIITATYQMALQPPGGVHQSENANANAGSVVMKQTFFILLWISNTVGFCCAVFYTFCLIPLGQLFTIWFFYIGTCLCISYALAMAVISPHPLVFLSATFALFLVFALYLLLEAFVDTWRKHRTVVPKSRFSWFWKVLQYYYI
ncbi:putative ankyrin repeat-containing domain, PGG domain, ankyrin repeat-containing domain superfamily [Arabidopsis thaliana]|uniref:Ankyrin repeat family protein n=1 Tax=Arabidopsis thaliana TaxID=3702 RepID=F4HW68_ARATH|nr:Ankyrin repeat family protein [Arabidopsis thaliana]AEE29170.1 Ankyrin repeat family protein [Arabidopsis thaliana]|eukprot:NP_001184993.1 Ankyrin repeat family protein [Arabidopsis thaliana]